MFAGTSLRPVLNSSLFRYIHQAHWFAPHSIILALRREVGMQITGMLYGARLLDYVEFPAAETLGPGATEDEIQGLIDRHKLIFIKPLFRGGIGKKGKAGLIGKATD